MAERKRLALSDPELERRFMAFQAEHPDLGEHLAMWMACASMVEIEDPEAAAILRRELPELAG
jgi:hypothetical protein